VIMTRNNIIRLIRLQNAADSNASPLASEPVLGGRRQGKLFKTESEPLAVSKKFNAEPGNGENDVDGLDAGRMVSVGFKAKSDAIAWNAHVLAPCGFVV